VGATEISRCTSRRTIRSTPKAQARLLPLLEFGREREGIDLSKVVLTHHTLKDQGKRQLVLREGDTP